MICCFSVGNGNFKSPGCHKKWLLLIINNNNNNTMIRDISSYGNMMNVVGLVTDFRVILLDLRFALSIISYYNTNIWVNTHALSIQTFVRINKYWQYLEYIITDRFLELKKIINNVACNGRITCYSIEQALRQTVFGANILT